LIRRARADEAETLLLIQREAAVAAFGHIFPPERYPFPDDDVLAGWRYALADPDVEAYFAEVDRGAVGSLSIATDFLRTLFVLPSHWNQGIGSALHDFALARLRKRGSKHAKLWTLEEAQAARRFYEKRGWRLSGERRVVPFPPNPIDVAYTLDLEWRQSR
jgi:GNAT superfamily N-acetyltransferase